MIFIMFMWLGTCYVVNCGWARMYVMLDVDFVSAQYQISLSVSHSYIHTHTHSHKKGIISTSVLYNYLQEFLNHLIDTLGMVSI